jgi:general secretion pathway protein F
MPSFRYKAYAPDGRALDGAIEAASRQAAIEALHRRGQFPFDVIEGAASAEQRWWEREVFAAPGLPHAQLALLVRELATLTQAELPIDESLRILAGQPLLKPRARAVVRGLLRRVTEGRALSEAMAAADGAFPSFAWQIVRAGEASNTLGPALGNLAHGLEEAQKTREKIRSATLYPLVLLAVAMAALALILFVLIPALGPLFKGVGAELPWTLRIMDRGRALLTASPLATLATLAAGVAGLLAGRRAPWWRKARGRLALRVPGVATLVMYHETARLARTLSTLLQSGVPLLDALDVTESTQSNTEFAAAVKSAKERVRGGTSLGAALADTGRFPEAAMRLITVGEKSSDIAPMAARVADIYEAALQRAVDRATALLAPLLTIVIGGIVGALILSVISATLSINDLTWR